MHPLVEQARRLDRKARHHKHKAGQHKQALREARQRQSEIEARCRELGIAVTYEGEGVFHGRTQRRKRAQRP